ncbi:hypothetical protein NXY28_18040 [Bacteroides thetaiotaomicron]|nr:hypothetical protein NXY28_18040 [Bacteroides thetaiotaomicron]
MVRGLEKFKEYFKDFSDNYIIIGGTACDIALTGSDMPPRATDDIDMILIVDNMTPEFGQRFWQFISEGEYQNRERKRGEGKEPVLSYSGSSNRLPVIQSASSCCPHARIFSENLPDST